MNISLSTALADLVSSLYTSLSLSVIVNFKSSLTLFKKVYSNDLMAMFGWVFLHFIPHDTGNTTRVFTLDLTLNNKENVVM